MPRKPEPTFDLKLIIWETAALVGRDKYTQIQNKLGDDEYAQIKNKLDYELERKREDLEIFQDTPDIRTIKKIMKEINDLDPEVVVLKLPPHLWHLRDDHESLNELAK